MFIVEPMDELSSQYEEAFGSGLIVPKTPSPIAGAPMPGAESLKIGDYN